MRLVCVERRQRGDVTGKDSEKSCLGPLPELSQTVAGKRNTKEGGGRLETDRQPNYHTCREYLWAFGFPKRALTYFLKCFFLIYQNTFLVNYRQVFCSFPIKSFSFNIGDCRLCLCRVVIYPAVSD